MKLKPYYDYDYRGIIKMPHKRVCVVGAGAAGLVALKECLRQGFEPVCYELDSDVGGIWHKKDYSQPTNTPSVWNNLTMNSSKFNSCFSDLPPRFEDTLYLTAEGMYQYFKRAVHHFGLEKYIHFNTRVIKIRKTSDHDRTGQWEVFTARRGGDIAGSDLAGPRGDDQSLTRCHREVFDFVLVCSGYFKVPIYPVIPGLDTFSGTVQHSFNYSDPKTYHGKTVLVVGNCVSAIDIANDIANVAKQVYIALGDGTWILPKCYSKSRTLDMVFSRSVAYQRNGLVKMNEIMMELANARIDHERAGIRSSRPPMLSAVGTNEDIQLKLLTGKVRAYGRFTGLQQDQAQFQDGKVISGIEAVVFCTGQLPDLSFLDLPIIEDNGKVELYKMVFPLHEKHHSLALIGHVGADFPLTACLEMQTRLATRVMAGKHELPSFDQMKKDVEFWNSQVFARRGKFDSYLVNGAVLTELLALEIGCYPTFWKIFIRDPLLAFRVWYGPMFVSQYRLLGPGSQWETAAKLCHAFYEEGHSSLQHRDVSKLDRPAIFGLNRTGVVGLLIISSATAVIGFVAYRYNMLQKIPLQ